MALGFLIPIISGVPDSLSCIPDSKPRIADFLTLGDEFSNFAARVTDDAHP